MLLYFEKLRILGNWQTKKLLSPSIGDVLPIDIIKLILIKTQVRMYQNNLHMNKHVNLKKKTCKSQDMISERIYREISNEYN